MATDPPAPTRIGRLLSADVLDEERARTRERVVATAALFILGLHRSAAFGATAGVLVSLLLAPVWAPVLRRYRWARLYGAVVGVALLCGLILAQSAGADHAVNAHNMRATLFLGLELFAGVGLILWARLVLPVWVVGTAFGLGMLVNAVLSPGTLGATNPLKFALLVPLAALFLSLVNRERRTVVELLLVIGLVGIAAFSDARAALGTGFVAVVLVAWQLRPRSLGRTGSATVTAFMLAALGFAIYNLASTLLINGYLGSAAQQRSIRQVETSGSLLLGGRPELSATWALMRHWPGGFGPGVVANVNEINVAKAGMLTVNYDPNNSYVNRFMFGSTVELHSMIGDLWAAFGIAGVVLCLFIVVLVVGEVSAQVALRRASGVVLFFAFWTLWNTMFSPFLSAAPTTVLAIGLLLSRRPEKGPQETVPGGPERGAAVRRPWSSAITG